MDFGFGKSDSEEGKSNGAPNFAGGFEMSEKRGEGSTEVYIGTGTKFDGEVHFEGPTYVNCKINGNVSASAALTVGPEGEIMGEIEGTEVKVCGKVQGNINANKMIALDRPAEVKGDLKSPKVSIADGVIFNGQCSMKSPGEIVDLKREATL